MNDVLVFSTYLIVGVMLGILYFSALWLSLLLLAHSRHLATSLMISFSLRLVILLVVFFMILDGDHWEKLLIALLGFITARVLMMLWLLKNDKHRKAKVSNQKLVKESLSS